MGVKQEFHCTICDEVLAEHTSSADCFFCGHREEAELLCPNGHYVCEDCRRSSPAQAVLRISRSNRSNDPFEIADLMMRHPSFKEHGPEHHIVVAPALLTAFRNENLGDINEGMVQEAIERCKTVPYGACGSMGACGACLGAGAFVSMIEKATFASDRERMSALKATAGAIERLSELGGARCCKQSVYTAISVAYPYIHGNISVEAPHGPVRCAFKDKIKDCKRERCPYY